MQQKIRLLFFHNTMPEYRIGWFKELAENADVHFVFTNEQLNKKTYGFEINYEKIGDLNCLFLSKGIQGIKELKKLVQNISQYDFAELPPIDSLREVIYSIYIVHECKKKKVKMGYFWEKWEAPIEKQPFKRRVKNLILRIIPGAIYKQADVIFYAGEQSRNYFISNGVRTEKLIYIPDVSETPDCEYIDIRKKYDIPQQRKIILYLGRVLPQKGVSNLIKAFSDLKSEIREKSFLMIAGDGEDLENCRRLVKQLQVRDICFTGSVDPLQRGNYFEQCDIFVYPVTYDGGWVDVWGLTLNEAIQHGKIVIATDAVGSAYELIENGVNGYRVEAENIEKLRCAIENSFNPQMIRSAERKDVELRKIFNYTLMSKKYLTAVIDLVGK